MKWTPSDWPFEPFVAQTFVERAIATRRLIDRQGNSPIEGAIAELLEEGKVQRHHRRMRRVYARRQLALVEALRLHMDARIAWAAKRAGADLVEGTPIENTAFDGKHWTLKSGSQSFKTRTLVLADGAHSKMVRALRLLDTTPQAMCSRAFIEGGGHTFRRDGICYMTKELLPGYAAIFRHPHDALNFCTYIIPGGKAQPSDLSEFHHNLLENNDFVRHHLGPNYSIEKMRWAWLRLGGIPKTYDEQLLIIGDAAGHIGPLTGEGIHLAMEAGYLPADTLARAFTRG